MAGPSPLSATRVALLYAVLASLWILVSDSFLELLIDDPSLKLRLAIYKGWIFVAVTAGLLYLVLRRAVDRDRQARAELAESEKRFRTLFEQAPVPIALTRNGRRLQVNKAYSDLFGYGNPEAVQGTPVDESVAPESRDLVHGQVSRRESGRAFEPFYEAVCMRQDGETFPVRVVSARFVLPDGPASLIFALDMREPTRAEQEIRRLNAELMARVRDLDAARREAEAASRSKSRFLASMSHELRTPLNGIMGLARLLLMSDSATSSAFPRAIDERGSLELILESGRRLLSLITDIMDYSQMDKGRLELHPTEFDPRLLAVRALDPIAAEAGAKGLDFLWSIEDVVPARLVGDAHRIAQILSILAGNAVKFTSRGQVRIRIWAEPQAGEQCAAGGQVLLRYEVADTGPGIPEERQAAVFEGFAQVDDRIYDRSHEGLGLGLAIARLVVEAMGGQLSLDSSLGRGSTFRFAVPAAVPAPREKILRPLRILVAEDEAINRLMVVSYLRRKGHTVAEAVTGLQVLEVLAREPFDAVLMDVSMPDMDGLAATREIRRGLLPHGNGKVPVIAVTAHALPGDSQTFLDEGMDDYLAKPFSLDDLDRVLLRAVRRDLPAHAGVHDN